MSDKYAVRVKKANDTRYESHVGLFLDYLFEDMEIDSDYVHYALHFWLNKKPTFFNSRTEAQSVLISMFYACLKDNKQQPYDFDIVEYVDHSNEFYVQAGTDQGIKFVDKYKSLADSIEDAAYFGSYEYACQFMCQVITDTKLGMNPMCIRQVATHPQEVANAQA